MRKQCNAATIVTGDALRTNTMKIIYLKQGDDKNE